MTTADHDAERQTLFALFDEAPVLMTFLEGADLRITRVNRRVRETTDAAALIGKTARELLRDDPRSLAILERVYATGQPESIPAMRYAGSAEPGVQAVRYFTRSFVPIRDVDGNVRGVLNTSTEVTAEVRERITREEVEHRAQAELQRMFALLDEAPIILTVVEHPEWRVTMANRLSRQLMGERPLIGTRLPDLVDADNPSIAAIERVYASGRSETHEVVSRTSGLAGRSFSTTLVPIRDPDGSSGRVMVAAVETTAAVEAGRAKDQFLAMLGHELRNPLAPILTAVQAMELDGIRSPALGIIERQVRHLTRLVDDLLDISRIARGVLVLNCEDLELVSVVTRALELAGPLFDQRGHRVVTDLVHRGLAVSGDPDRLAQVVTNLVTNAAKYSEPGSRIRIVGQRNGDRVVLRVCDDGIGIAPEVLDHVFEPFVQQPQSQERSRGGLGLGLSIVKRMVEAHGGTVSAHSDGLGRGSTFVVELPAIEDRRATVDGARAVSTLRPLSRGSATPLRILVVDDNHEAADILEIALTALGHSIAIAYDGPSALDLAKTHLPQIALVDLGLPVMDGYRLAELLRADHDIPVVAITGYGQERDRQRTTAAGFAAHLVKPVDLRDLAQLVTRLCAEASPARALH